ncbi:hypothetical protein FRB99_002621 [Tulasnella sp. 403]|nr:hypothetical protein FRB99_002621 [Tulasnella sp. 403]
MPATRSSRYGSTRNVDRPHDQHTFPLCDATQPLFHGFVYTLLDAFILVQAAVEGLVGRVIEKPAEAEKQDYAKNGTVVIFEEEESGIQRWSDSIAWSATSLYGEYIIYRELTNVKPTAAPKDYRISQKRLRSIQGSLPDGKGCRGSGWVLPDGLIKRTVSIPYGPKKVFHYLQDILSGRFVTPSTSPHLSHLKDHIPESLLDRGLYKRTTLDIGKLPSGRLVYVNERLGKPKSGSESSLDNVSEEQAYATLLPTLSRILRRTPFIPSSPDNAVRSACAVTHEAVVNDDLAAYPMQETYYDHDAERVVQGRDNTLRCSASHVPQDDFRPEPARRVAFPPPLVRQDSSTSISQSLSRPTTSSRSSHRCPSTFSSPVFSSASTSTLSDVAADFPHPTDDQPSFAYSHPTDWHEHRPEFQWDGWIPGQPTNLQSTVSADLHYPQFPDFPLNHHNQPTGALQPWSAAPPLAGLASAAPQNYCNVDARQPQTNAACSGYDTAASWPSSGNSNEATAYPDGQLFVSPEDYSYEPSYYP